MTYAYKWYGKHTKQSGAQTGSHTPKYCYLQLTCNRPWIIGFLTSDNILKLLDCSIVTDCVCLLPQLTLPPVAFPFITPKQPWNLLATAVLTFCNTYRISHLPVGLGRSRKKKKLIFHYLPL